MLTLCTACCVSVSSCGDRVLWDPSGHLIPASTTAGNPFSGLMQRQSWSEKIFWPVLLKQNFTLVISPCPLTKPVKHASLHGFSHSYSPKETMASKELGIGQDAWPLPSNSCFNDFCCCCWLRARKGAQIVFALSSSQVGIQWQISLF